MMGDERAVPLDPSQEPDDLPAHAMLDLEDENSAQVAKQLEDALPDIYDGFIAANRELPPRVMDALTGVLGFTPHQMLRHYAEYARSKGSSLLTNHYPDFGHYGCEYPPPKGMVV